MLPYRDSLMDYNPSWDQGLDILPALDLAADQINDRHDILPCHELELVHIDGGCDIIPKTRLGIFDGLFSGEEVVGVVGPGCSLSSVAMSNVTNRPEIDLVILHDAGSPLLANRDWYNNSVGILGSTQAFSNLSFALMNETEWQNIAILYESSRLYYRSTAEDFVKRLHEELPKVKILFKAGVFKTFYPLNDIKTSLARIVFLFTSPDHSKRIMCLAQYEGMVYPGYQWIMASRRLDDFSGDVEFPYEGRNHYCSNKTMVHTVLNYTFIMNYQLSAEKTSTVFPLANTTFTEFVQLYEDRVAYHNRENPNDAILRTYWAYNMYDAVWAWAAVLDKITYQHECITFNYRNETLTNMIREQFYRLKFDGMSGYIMFNPNNGFINRKTNLYQIVDGVEKYITFTNGSDVIEFQKDSYVAIPDIVRQVGLPCRAFVVFFFTLECSEFIAIVALHVLTYVYRKTKSIKASSPTMTHFVFAGLYLLNIATILLSISEIDEHSAETNGILCHTLWAWLLPISFTLIVGTIVVRTWRLYRIFTHYLDPGSCISTPVLIIILLIMLSIDLSIALIWTAADPMQEMLVSYEVRNGPANEQMLDRMCNASIFGGFLWIATVHGYKLLLLALMVMLTVLTRSIPNQTFTTSSLQVFSYIFSFVYVAGFISFYLALTITHDANVDYGTLSIMLNIMLCLIIACIVAPPLLSTAKEKYLQRRMLHTKSF